MDRYAIYNFIRSRYPSQFGIRKNLQRLKIKRLKGQLLNDSQRMKCESDPGYTRSLLSAADNKTKSKLSRIMKEMESTIENACFKTDDIDFLKRDMQFCWLAYGFLPSEYCGFELENKLPDERKTYMSDNDTYVFGYKVNDISFLQRVIDKGQACQLFGHLFKRDYLVVERKNDFPSFEQFTKKHPVFVKKSTNSSMGRNIEKVDISTIDVPLKTYFDSAIKQGKLLLEELVVQHESMSRFNDSSVNTVRCMTFLTRKGVQVPYCFMRVGRAGAFVDNGGAGGILIGVNPDTGILDSCGYDEFDHCFASHPDSGVSFIGEQIPEWDNMISICKKEAEKLPQMGYLSWDMSYTDEGWKVIEVNGIGQLIGPQTVYKRGIKNEIDHYLGIMQQKV